MDVHVELGRHNVPRIIIANGRLMNVHGLNCLTGVADKEAHAEHVTGESVVAPGRSEPIVEQLPVPGAALHAVRQTDPGVLGIGARPEEPQGLIDLFVVPQQSKQLVLHMYLVQMLQRIIAEDIGVRIDDDGIRGHLLVRILQQIGVGQAFPNDLLLDLGGVFAAAPFIAEILFVQQDDLVDQGIRHVVLQTLANLLLALCHGMHEVLGDEPDLGDRIGIADLDTERREVFYTRRIQLGLVRDQVIKMEQQSHAGYGVADRSVPGTRYDGELHEFFENADADLEGDPLGTRKLLEDGLGDEKGDLVSAELFEFIGRQR